MYLAVRGLCNTTHAKTERCDVDWKSDEGSCPGVIEWIVVEVVVRFEPREVLGLGIVQTCPAQDWLKELQHICCPKPNSQVQSLKTWSVH